MSSRVQLMMMVVLMMMMAVMMLQIQGVSAEQDSGTVIPAESRPCVDCHAFEFMQRALQDLKKTAFSLDSRTESLVLRAEKKALCDCTPATALH
ncbi:NELL2-interacting cell ontogeny regulator 1 [Denticeps clupeoides]|uniref:NELL2-interacting cell ontogeny regulator 1 n=1 Tax=Denticeps clupeoides TaxID=299321 RepID=A0AAY4BS82_9TELE|nr:neuropeptide-like protein C4orf48 homolog [Denticeps clupeoides]